MTKKTILLGIASTGLLAMALPAQAALAYDADVTPNVIFGIGNGNGYFTVDQENGIELGLRAKIRYQGVYNSDGAGTYSFLPTDNWNIEWSINSDYLETSGVKLNGLTYKLTGQFFSLPGFSGDPVNSINPFPPYYYDHSFGNNSTAQGAGVEATSASDYANLIANYNVVQNSWSPGELTQIKCYRDGEVDEGSTDTLTHICGYRSPEHESLCQTRGPGPHSRPLSACRSAAQDAHPG